MLFSVAAKTPKATHLPQRTIYKKKSIHYVGKYKKYGTDEVSVGLIFCALAELQGLCFVLLSQVRGIKKPEGPANDFNPLLPTLQAHRHTEA